MDQKLNSLPPDIRLLETIPVLKKLTSAHRYLAELKGLALSIPNETILINTLGLQEAKDSSAIENIITTQDEMYKQELFEDYIQNPAAKEVNYYARALRKGLALVREKGILTNNHILTIQKELLENDAGFRKLPGTALKNQQTGETIYVPPQEAHEIMELMNNLETFINDDSLMNVDPLIKMAVIHYQFESIHPFYDGNGRTGRIINILYLVLKDLLRIPVLYLSRYIIRNKNSYYTHLQSIRDTGHWEDWILYILEGIEATSRQTIWVIQNIKSLMLDYKHRIREKFPRIYSQDLLNNLFLHPYTKIYFIQHDLGVTRLTATQYLERLVEAGFLEKQKIGRNNFYINRALYELFMNIPDEIK